MKKFAVILFLFTVQTTYSQTVTAVVEDKTKKIEVTGSAEIEIVPDEIYVNFTLQEYYDKSKKKIDIDQIQKDFLDRCTKAGISKDRIQIQNMSGFDQNNWYWRKKKKEQPDMLASTVYIIKFTTAADIDKLVNTLDDNATTNMYISRTSHSQIEDYRKQMKVKALQAAKAKAQYLCEGIGEKVGKALYIQEIENQGPVMYGRMEMSNAMMKSQDSANEGIDFQKIKVRMEVLARFEIQ
jgi:uncharacterized protein YggE